MPVDPRGQGLSTKRPVGDDCQTHDADAAKVTDVLTARPDKPIFEVRLVRVERIQALRDGRGILAAP